MTRSQSEKISITTFLATVLVVYRHAFNLHLYYPNGGPWMKITDWNIAFQRTANALTAVAIPAFFLISGFLFFEKASSFQAIGLKLYKRLRTLVLPYLLWNIGSLIFWLVAASIPILHSEVMNTFKFQYNCSWFLSKITTKPILGHFWYIRTLFLFCCFTPLLFLIYKSRIFTIALLIYLFYRWWPIDTSLLSGEGAFFFVLGGAINQQNWRCPISNRIVLLIGIIGTVLLLPFSWKPAYPGWFFRPLIFALLILLFSTAHLIYQCKWKKVFLFLGSFSFMIYALHAPMDGILNKGFRLFAPSLPILSCTTYLIFPLLNISWIILLSILLRKKTSYLYQLMTGNRGIKRIPQ